MKYSEFLKRTEFSKEELIAFGYKRLIDDLPTEDFASLPIPPMLMFDRITKIEHQGRKGAIVAEQDIDLAHWFFHCHFLGDPVQPGCLGVDAVWQLLGFYICTRGFKGSGRALGSKEIEFFGQIRPHNKIVRYEVDVHRYKEFSKNETAFAIGSATISVDDEPIYTIKDAKVGMFKGIKYSNYPLYSKTAIGGKMQDE